VHKTDKYGRFTDHTVSFAKYMPSFDVSGIPYIWLGCGIVNVSNDNLLIL